MNKKKLLIIQDEIMPYREALFNILSETFDVTLAYGLADYTSDNVKFHKLKFPVKRVGPFKIYGNNFIKECRKYDIIVTNYSLRNPQFCYLALHKKKQPVLTWGIGFRASYTLLYDVDRKHTFLDKVSELILRTADANIIYMDKAREFWSDNQVDPGKFFTAVNTVPVVEPQYKGERNSLLYLGSLFRAKGIDKLINSFIEATAGKDSDIQLNIIGGGDEELKAELMKQVADAGVSDRVNFVGPVYDEHLLADYFAHALACISPDQAGLTVPKAMGYGVTMVTKRNAISGGEIYHISDGETGILYDTDAELTGVITDIIQKPDKYASIGATARNYYVNHATPRHQAQGFIDALHYALSSHSK